ncbi:tRNA (N6-isopentenyl adenosine(37)-C2)-methylthiotransferase MiaB [bacterium]|nr:tRNA (N6-isopentenyl adenosine(37)-C2)-methylthiotransferase MiaB [bacterium]
MKERKDPKTFFVRTYGCQMNELDSEIMIGELVRRGLSRVYTEEEGDILIYNTCSIRDLAERKVMGKLGILGRSKTRDKIIGVTGCMAMAKKESLFKKLPHLDFILGTNNISNLGAVLDEVIHTGKQTAITDKKFEEDLDYLSAKRESNISAHVSIIRGCDKYCTYCVVPYTRGREVSRPYQAIVDEVKGLVDQGYKEVTLLGQNVNSYGKDQKEWGVLFHDLLEKIDTTGIERVRFLTSHPVDITKNLMEAVRDLRSLCEFVHFPMQAGSNRILRKMHRIYTLEEYFEKVAMLKEIVPGVALGTDMIVGFPTESDEEFEQTYSNMEKVNYSTAFLYTYSPRKGTPAMRFKDDISEEVKKQRLNRLADLHKRQAAEQMTGLIGNKLEVLFEGRNSRGQLKGRTRCWRKVICDGPESLIGELGEVEIVSFHHETMIGNLVPSEAILALS